ncbi:Hypothetical predicted protein [Cloeon dipterum]|uniref:Uncharacterized protein n=1 Tax=Cloeon dipterum TaxID=197152 RepID=A0A8S1D787_9INSE|nr:Hypothetical predicted protein [Cloeon dipterum]
MCSGSGGLKLHHLICDQRTQKKLKKENLTSLQINEKLINFVQKTRTSEKSTKRTSLKHARRSRSSSSYATSAKKTSPENIHCRNISAIVSSSPNFSQD